MTFGEFRGKINSIATIEDLTSIISYYGITATKSKSVYADSILRIKGYVIGWNRSYTTMYVTKSGELLLLTKDPLDKDFVNFILDELLELNTSDAFYKLYFRIFHYIIPDNVSDEVKETFNYFKNKQALIDSIYTSVNYNSVTVTGKRLYSNTDIEYRIARCSKQDILDIVEITHIQPVVNKPNNLEFYDKPCMNRPFINEQDIMDCYNEYKDSLAYE